MMHKVTINGKKSYEVNGTSSGSVELDGRHLLIDMVRTGERFFHILYEGRSFEAEIVHIDRQTKTVTLKVNHLVFEANVKDRLDLMLDQMGLTGAAQHKIKNMKAPMPGLVIDVRVSEGQQVKKGDPVIVLEAMKMENVLKAAGDGTVKTIEATKGKSVEKGQVLIVFE